MSCNIFDAWECPASFTMAEAVVLAKEAADIQHASARNEIVDSFDGINWMPWYDYIVETFGDNSGQLGRIVAAGIFPVMQSHYLSLVNVFPTSCESELDATLRKLTGSMSIANRGDTLDAMHSHHHARSTRYSGLRETPVHTEWPSAHLPWIHRPRRCCCYPPHRRTYCLPAGISTFAMCCSPAARRNTSA